MLGRLRDLTINRDGSQNITVTVSSDFRPVFDGLAGVDVDIEIKRHQKKRSLSANAYCWVLTDKIAAATGQTKEDVYRETIRNIGGVSDIVCCLDKAVEDLRRRWASHGVGWISDTMPSKIDGCTNVILYSGSSTYDVAQMSRLIDLLVAEAKDLGIETATPDEIKHMQMLWERKHG